MKLSKLESDGTKIQKVFKGAQKQEVDLVQELEEVKELLHQILQKLDKKS